MLGICTNSLNNCFDDLLDIQQYLDTFECSKTFYIDNFQKIDRIKLNCSCFNSLILGNYDLTTPSGRKHFVTEFEETCRMANDLNCKKLMFGLLRYRKVINSDITKLFIELIDIANDYKLALLYEALSESQWITNHSQLIDFSKHHNLPSIHVDFGTLKNEHETFNDLRYNISNIHYPIGLPIMYDNVSLENYNNYSIKEIKTWIRSLL